MYDLIILSFSSSLDANKFKLEFEKHQANFKTPKSSVEANELAENLSKLNVEEGKNNDTKSDEDTPATLDNDRKSEDSLDTKKPDAEPSLQQTAELSKEADNTAKDNAQVDS